MCYGTCPVYVVEIHSDGRVIYEGEGFVEKTGHHEWTLDPDAVTALNGAIKRYGYFSFEAREPTEMITCSPSCITSVLLEDGTYREIDNYYGSDAFPVKLQRFETKIDDIIGIKKYVGKKF
jgi:hypothetical protein